MVQSIVDFIVSKIQFSTKVEMIMFASISLAALMLSLLLWFIIDSTREEIIIQAPTYPEEDISSFQKILDERKEKGSTAGSTSKYSWTQNEQEVDIFIPIQEYTLGQVISSDISVDIKGSFIDVKIAGETIISDSFYADVIPSECNWQIEDAADQTRRLWINLYKKKSTTKSNHWRHILLTDENAKQMSVFDRTEGDSRAVDRLLEKME